MPRRFDDDSYRPVAFLTLPAPWLLLSPSRWPRRGSGVPVTDPIPAPLAQAGAELGHNPLTLVPRVGDGSLPGGWTGPGSRGDRPEWRPDRRLPFQEIEAR